MSYYANVISALTLVASMTVVTFAFADSPGVVILPNETLTPGVVASTDEAEVCGTVGGLSYSKRHRHTTADMKAQVRQLYGRAHCGEIDHRLELSLGGADDVKNLWCEPGPDETVWNYKLKDKMEANLWRAVCKTGTMSLADAQAIFLAPDWRVEYCKLFPGAPCELK